MLELQLKQPGFTYSARGLIPKPCERIQKIREKGNLSHLYRNGKPITNLSALT